MKKKIYELVYLFVEVFLILFLICLFTDDKYFNGTVINEHAGVILMSLITVLIYTKITDMFAVKDKEVKE